MKSQIRIAINQANAQKSTGPLTPEGKRASCLNAFKHGLTGQRMLLQEHELEAYRLLHAALHAEHSPKTETERQLVQKIVDSHARLNRIAALDGNILNISLAENTDATCEDDRVDSIVAQAHAFTEQSSDFDKLGRYESRIARQLMQYTKELARVQGLRQPHETKSLNPELASFGNLTKAAAAASSAATVPPATVRSATVRESVPQAATATEPLTSSASLDTLHATAQTHAHNDQDTLHAYNVQPGDGADTRNPTPGRPDPGAPAL